MFLYRITKKSINSCFVGLECFQISGTKAPVSQTHYQNCMTCNCEFHTEPTAWRPIGAGITSWKIWQNWACWLLNNVYSSTCWIEPDAWNINNAECPLVHPRFIKNCQTSITLGHKFLTRPKNSYNWEGKLSRQFTTNADINKLKFDQNVLVKINIKFHENPRRGNQQFHAARHDQANRHYS